jgi:uncharacterized protein (DUF58 family)
MLAIMPDRETSPVGDRSGLAGFLGHALSHDFCPWANRYVYWLKHPLVVLALGALVALAIGAAALPQGYVVCGGLVAVMVLGVAWPWIAMLGVQAELRFERRRVREGECSSAVLSVLNRMPWPAWGLVLESGFLPAGDGTSLLPADADTNHVAVALALVPGWSRSEFRWEFEPRCRGEYPLAPPKLATAFPFGLWKRSKPVTVQSRLLVWPQIVHLEALPLDQGHSWTLGALSYRRSGTQGDILGTRHYRPGDAIRHVHWAQTARQAQMVVCERQSSLTSSVRVVLDVTGGGRHHGGPDEPLEWAMRVAASVCHAVLNHDGHLMAGLGEALLTVQPGGSGEQRLNDALARFQSSGTVSHSPSRKVSLGDSDELEIVVTTDQGAYRWFAGSHPCRRLIVLRTEASSMCSNPSAWIELDSGRDVLSQLEQQWNARCGHDH